MHESKLKSNMYMNQSKLKSYEYIKVNKNPMHTLK